MLKPNSIEKIIVRWGVQECINGTQVAKRVMSVCREAY